MRHVTTISRIVFRRSVASWQLLTTVVIGVVLAAALMSTVALYSDTVRDLGLQHALQAEDPLDLDIHVLASSQRLNPSEYEDIQRALAEQTGPLRDSISEGTAQFVRSATFFPTAPGEAVDLEDDLRPRAHFISATDFADHIRLIEGSQPNPDVPSAGPDTPPAVEVIVSSAVAAKHHLSVGTRFDLHPFWALDAEPVKATIVGLFEPLDNAGRYWGGSDQKYNGPVTSWPTYPLLVASDRVIVDAVAAYLTTIDGIVEWTGFVDIGTINSRNAKSVESGIGGLRGGLLAAIPRTSVSTTLDQVIDTYQSKLFFTRLPLFALMLQIVGISLYYLVMVATMLQERQVGEIALLRSRGASIYQIVGMAAIEGAFICGTAVVLGPLLAAGGIAVLGLTPPFHDLSDGELLRVPLTQMAFIMAGIGAGLAYLTLLWPAYQAARKTMIDYKITLARPEQQPLFLRYYLDLVLIGAAAFAFYQLRQRGSLVTERLFGGLSADPLLLISPILFMLMVALVFIRLFPLALRLVAALTGGLRGPTVALGMWRMVRSPMQYSRLILLLLLATAVGMFAAGFRATLERSYDDRAAYEAVSGARIGDVRVPLGLPQEPFVSLIEAGTGAEVVTPVVRLDGGYNKTPFDRVDLDVLGVVPEEAAKMVFWRDDFAGRSVDKLLREVTLEAPYEATTGPTVPAGAETLGAWVYTSTAQRTAQPWVRLKAADGTFFEYRLFGPSEQPTEGGWQFFATDLSHPTGHRQRITLPRTTLDAVFIRISGQPPPFPETITVLFDDLQVTSARADLVEVITAQEDPGWEVIEDFEHQEQYEVIAGSSRTADFGAISRADLEDREGSAMRISFVRQFGTPPVVGMRVSEELKVVPVIADKAFLKEADLEKDEEFLVYFNHQYVPVRVVDTFDLFPTYDPASRRHLLVGDIRTISLLGSRVPFFADEITPTEAWLEGVTRPLTRETLNDLGISAGIVLERSQLRAEAGADPLVAASWQGILFLSFSAVLLLTALGFGVYAVLAARARTLEFAILRTMGYTSRQILALVSFEQLFVIAAGVAVGTTLGFPLGRLMLSYLGTTESGTDPLPPLVSEVSWVTVLTVYSLLAAVFVLTVGALARTYSRLAIASALRIGEI